MADLPVQADSAFGAALVTAEQVFREHHDNVYRIALSLSGNRADAEDIAQETFVAIIGALPGYRGEARLSTWIYRITLRVGMRWLARRKLADELPTDLVAMDQSIPVDLIRAMSRLPMDSRMVILLIAIEGLSHAEVAEILAIPVGTVASRLHYARQRLVDLLDS